MLGGGMRQAGLLAAAGIYALNTHVKDLVTDHERAQHLAQAIAMCPGLEIDPQSVQTNIVIFKPTQQTPADFCAAVSPWLRVLPFGRDGVRAVLHRDVGSDDLRYAINALQDYCVRSFE